MVKTSIVGDPQMVPGELYAAFKHGKGAVRLRRVICLVRVQKDDGKAKVSTLCGVTADVFSVSDLTLAEEQKDHLGYVAGPLASDLVSFEGQTFRVAG